MRCVIFDCAGVLLSLVAARRRSCLIAVLRLLVRVAALVAKRRL